jgi:hypothetical protein
MRAPRRLFAVVAVLAVGVGGWSGFGSSAQEKGNEGVEKARGAADPPKWEYKLTQFAQNDKADEKELNRLGGEGWELVAVTPFGPQNALLRGTFKRPKK